MSTTWPTVRGAGGGGKAGGGAGGAPSEDPDSLRSRQYARVLDLLSEGPIVGLVDGLKSVYLDETPFQNADGSYNFKGVTVATRTGEQVQGYIPGMDEVESEIAVSTEVTAGASVTRSISGDVDALRITVSVPQLTFQDPDTGNLTGSSVQLAVDVNNNGGGFVQVAQDTISGKCTSRYQRSWRIPLPAPGPWDVRVRRITADSTQVNLQNKTWWDSYTRLTEAKLSYPNSALAAIAMDASQFSSVPTRGYDVKLRIISVPNNYDPVTRSYSGAWDGNFIQAWSDNPAWVFYDLLTNARYGLGQFIDAAQIDKWSLYTIAQYCDELVPDGFGGNEPRFTCNLYLQTRQEAFTVLQQLASVFRGMTFWQDGQVVAVQDAPADVMALFTPANVVGGAFNYQGAGTKARHTVALIAWNDPSDHYRQAIEYVSDDAGIARFGVIETQVVAIGCTSRGQAHRLGRWLLYSERLESETVSFAAALDAAPLVPGAIIQVQDPYRSGQRFGGRVLEATTSSLTIDNPITLADGETYSVSVILPDGSIASADVTNAAGTASVLTLAVPLPVVPLTGAVWVVAASNLAPTTWRVLNIRSTDGMTVEVLALAHNPSKYGFIEQGLLLETPPVTVLDPNGVPALPINLTAVESLYRAGPGTIATRLSCGWEPVVLAKDYAVELRGIGNNTGSSSVQRVSSAGIDFAPVAPGDYSLYVRGISGLGVTGPRARLDFTVYGLSLPPADVVGFAWQTEGYGTRLRWTANTELDLAGYELRIGASWDTATPIATVAATTYFWQVQQTGTLTVWIAALDTTGHRSTNPVALAVTITAPDAPAVTWALDAADELLSWTIPAAQFAIDRYEVRYGDAWATATMVDRIKSTALRRRVDYGGNRTWWVAAIDVAGNIGTPGSVGVTVNPLGQVQSPLAEVVDNNVLLRWRPPNSGLLLGVLPVDHYLVRKGATWASGDPTQDLQVSATFATIFEQASGLYTYWIAPVDTAGTVGTPRAISATVAQPPDYVLRTVISDDFTTGAPDNVLVVDADTLLAPVDPAQTWQGHFTANSWTAPQDQITAGYPVYLQPVPVGGTYQQEFDYGAVLPSTVATVAFTAQTVAGAPVVLTLIEWRASTTDAWSAAPLGAMQALLINVRYLRITLSVDGDGHDITEINGLTLKLSNKLRTDSGRGTITTASTGVYVPFNVSFIDADTPLVQPEGTTPLLPVVDFADVPNPIGFTVYLYTTAGVKTTGSFSWTARGY